MPVAFHRPDPLTKLLVIVVSGPLLSLGLAFYYCIYWPSFMELVPPDKIGLRFGHAVAVRCFRLGVTWWLGLW